MLEKVHLLSHAPQVLAWAVVPALVLLALARGHRRLLPLAWLLLGVGGLGVLSVLVDGFTSARLVTMSATCMEHEKELARGISLYVDDWDQRLPPARTWGDVAARTAPAVAFRCPAGRTPFGFWYNRAL